MRLQQKHFSEIANLGRAERRVQDTALFAVFIAFNEQDSAT
jgi:hypothetical protein